MSNIEQLSSTSSSASSSSTADTDANANEQPIATVSGTRPDSNFPELHSALDSIMTDALHATTIRTVDSVETLRSIVERYERSFEQFRLETERAIATCRREFNDIRKKFEKLRRIRRSLVIRYVERGAARVDTDSDGPPPPKRKRWGKKSSTRRRPNVLD